MKTPTLHFTLAVFCLQFLTPLCQGQSSIWPSKSPDRRTGKHVIGRCGCEFCTGPRAHIPGDGEQRFQLTGRWTETTTSGGGLQQGDPTILTWSIIPDGTKANSDGIQGGNFPSDLIARFDIIFNDPNAGTSDLTNRIWFARIQQALDRWGEISGLEYVYEPNDDGSPNFEFAGEAGVRGDVRIGGYNIDGSSGILGYNPLPLIGDMALDTSETSIFGNSSGDFLAFRNVVSHEAGHGMGVLHVCPADQVKLMEPFISTAYDGPQFDDILACQRHYGDAYEKMNSFEGNDVIGNAIEMGTLIDDQAILIGSDGANGLMVNRFDTDFVSIDGNSDIDFFEYSLSGPGQVTVNVRPVGESYLQGPQTQNCNSGSSFDPLLSSNLSLALFDAQGNQIAFVDDASAGENETISLPVVASDSVIVRIAGAGNVQLYELSVTADYDGLFLELPNGFPDVVNPAGGTSIQLEVADGSAAVASGSGLLYVDTGNGFEAFPLVENSATSFTAITPPVTCGEEAEFYFSLDAKSGETFTLPAGAPDNNFRALGGTSVKETFSDSFEADLGWTVSGDATDGQWEWAIPNNGDRGDPSIDVDPDGAGFCLVTDNDNIPNTNTDVDGGTTIITSPLIDASTENVDDIVFISYSRWYSNDFGDAPFSDVFVVEISNDAGASWVELETVGPTGPEVSGGWFFKRFRVNDFLEPTNEFQIRFNASDLGDGSIVEAAVDAVQIETLTCAADLLLGDANGDGVFNNGDIASFVLALTNAAAYQAMYPNVDSDVVLDMNGDGFFNNGDIGGFVAALTGGGTK